MSPVMWGLLGLVFFLFIVANNVPIAVAMGVVGVIGFSIVESPEAALRVLPVDIYNAISSYSLSVLPMFVLMGFIAYHSGLGADLYRFAYKLFGRINAGLIISSQVACAIFGAVCGSATATAATIGSIAIPEMKKYKYSDSLATGSIAAGGAIGVLIPPSTIFIVYGISTEQSITKLFLSGVFPGILLTVLYSLAAYILAKRNPALAPASTEPRPTFKEIWEFLRGSLFLVILIFCIVIGGLFAGWFTATEGGAVGAFAVLAVTILFGKMSFKKFAAALTDTTKTTAMVMLLVGGAMIFTRFIAVSRLPFALSNWINDLGFSPVLAFTAILIVYGIGGMFIEVVPLILLTVPIFYPTVTEVLGYDPIWFGVIIVMVTAIGIISPPVGINVYVTKSICPDVSLETIFSGVWPFIVAAIIAIIILMIFPQIATFLPNLMMG